MIMTTKDKDENTVDTVSKFKETVYKVYKGQQEPKCDSKIYYQYNLGPKFQMNEEKLTPVKCFDKMNRRGDATKLLKEIR